jgi:glucokinase
VEGDLSKVTPKIISEAHRKGDALSGEILVEAGIALGALLAGMVNLVNPEKIILGGGIAQAGDVLFDSIRATISTRAMSVLAENVEIVPAKLGIDAGIVSGAALIFGA